MATVKLLSDDELSPEARAVFADIRKTRQSDFVNNFWRALAHDPKTLRRTWESIKEVMGPGALDPKVKEMLYVAVSIAHGCSYCIHSHTASARAKGMTDAEYREMLAIVGMAAETNRLVTALGGARGRRIPCRCSSGTNTGFVIIRPGLDAMPCSRGAALGRSA